VLGETCHRPIEVRLALSKSFLGCQVPEVEGLLLQKLLVLLVVGLDVELLIALQQDGCICDG
jgi:hypothetical protein